MPSAQKFVKSCQAFLANTGAFSSFPLSFVLLGLEKGIELQLSCPCSNDSWNKLQISFIFIGPFLFITAVMFIILKPFGYAKTTTTVVDLEMKPLQDSTSVENGNGSGADSVQISHSLICCVKNKTRGDQTNSPKANEDEDVPNNLEIIANCLIPPVIWIIILLLDGDYLACCQTTWKGNYVFNKELNRKWCQPIEQSRAANETDLQHEYEMFISRSQFGGYFLLAILSLLIIWKVCYFNCQKTK